MRNNTCKRIIAWIMTAALVICALGTVALADGENSQLSDPTAPITLEEGPAKINSICQVNLTLKKASDNTVISDLSKLSTMDKTECILTLDVKDKDNILPLQGEIVYDLPDGITDAKSGSNKKIAWTYDAKANQLKFSWISDTKTSFVADVEVTVAGIYELYNMAVVKVNGNDVYYRLGKTTITTPYVYKHYNNNKVLSAAEYESAMYDFSNTTITINGITYIYEGDEQDPDNPMPYYSVKLEKVEISQSKVGGMNGNTPRWMVADDSMKYNDPNTTGGYHRNYRLTLYTAPEVQTLYNFIGIDKKSSYYRLKTTKILAKPVGSFTAGQTIPEDEYTLIPDTDYDFTNVVLTINGEQYKYSPVEIQDEEYESYYTVEFERVFMKKNIHGDANWFKKEEGWLDGSKETYNGITNNTTSFHRDYFATLHKGNATFYNIEMHDGDNVETERKAGNKTVELIVPTKPGYEFVSWNTAEDGSGEAYNTVNPLNLTNDIILYAQWSEIESIERRVTVSSSLAGVEKVFAGTEITLTANLEGYDDVEVTYQWQYEDPQNPGVLVPIENETNRTYTFNLDKTNCTYYYYVTVTEQ